MKKFSVLVAIIAVCGINRVASGQDSAAANAWKSALAGPFFEGGGAVSAGNVASGAKTNFLFAWATGARGVFPLAPNIALSAALGYDARSIEYYKQDDQNFKFDYTFDYFAIRPGIQLGDFSLGLGLGIPLGYSVTVQQGAGQSSKTSSIGASGMNFLLELRLGAAVPLIQNENGQLQFLVEASYAFNHLVANGPLSYYGPGTQSSASNNGPLATLQLGFAYLFNLNPQ
ncbi:MAG TPA: hypothetical protein VFH95_06635 [Candidatus Kapabacteria bacterium]|nr:hypothetical protein [Candidatus Kapabacteria bacterium]